MTCSDQTEIRFFHHDLCPNVNFNIWINTRKANLIYCQLKQIKSLRSKSKLKQHIPFLLPSLLRLNFTLWTPNFSVSPCPRQHSKVEYGHCSQSVTASYCCSIMGPLHRLQSFSKACSGMAPLHGPQFLQKNLHLLTALWSAGKILPLLLLSPWCSEDCFTFFLTPLCRAALCPFLQTPPDMCCASPVCSAVSCGGFLTELPGTSCVLHRATHTRAPELSTEAQTESWTLQTSWLSPVLSFKLCPKSHLWGHSGADPQTDLDSQQYLCTDNVLVHKVQDTAVISTVLCLCWPVRRRRCRSRTCGRCFL